MGNKRLRRNSSRNKISLNHKNKSSSAQTLKTPAKNPVVTIILILLVLSAGTVTIVASTGAKSTKKVTTAKIAYSLESCSLISGNARISCVAGAAELTGYRYASAIWSPAPLSWTEYWRVNGFPNLTIVDGGFGKNPKSWWEKRTDDSQNFLDCVGFVNVVHFLATGIDPYGPDPSKVFDIYSDTNLDQITDLKSLQPGDTIVKLDDKVCHVGIFSSYNVNKTITINTFESNSDNSNGAAYRTGPRTRDIGWWTSAVRYKHPEVMTGNSLPNIQ